MYATIYATPQDGNQAGDGEDVVERGRGGEGLGEEAGKGEHRHGFLRRGGHRVVESYDGPV